MDLAVDRHDRGQAARAETCNRLQREDAVVRCLVLASQTEVFPHSVIDRLGFPNMTCRAVADLDDVLALGFQREILEESRHAVHLGDRNAKLARDQLQIALAEIAVLRLNILKNRDQRGLAATMLVDDLHDLCALRFVHLLFPPYITDFTVFTVDKKRGRALGTRATGQEQTRPILWPSVFCVCNIVYNIIIYQKINVIFVQDAPCAFVQDAPYHTIFHISFPNRLESPVFAPGAR